MMSTYEDEYTRAYRFIPFGSARVRDASDRRVMIGGVWVCADPLARVGRSVGRVDDVAALGDGVR